MTSSTLRSSSIISRTVDLIVLATSFILLVVATGFGHSMGIIVDLLFYVAVMFISLRLSKRVIFEYVDSSGRMVSVLLGNISGLIVGAALTILINQFLPGISENTLIVVFSSILAFFILGTLSPMVKTSYYDIIQH